MTWPARSLVLALALSAAMTPSSPATRAGEPDRSRPATKAIGERVRTVVPGTVLLRWRASDRGSGIHSYVVQVATRRVRGQLRYRRIAVVRRPRVRLQVRAGRSYHVRVLARDRAGNRERDRRADFVLRVPAAAAGVSVAGLETEGVAELLGADVRRPRLSWRLGSSRRGVRQMAFEVLVASSPELLRAGSGDVFESGRQVTGRPWIQYKGPRLRSHTRYHWTVRVWDEKGRATAWARPTWFETAFLSPSEWEADWIGRALAPGEPTPPVACDAKYGGMAGPRDDAACTPPSPVLRTEFDVAKPVASARLYASGLGYGVYRLNGKRVGDLELSPSFTDYDEHVFYVTHDVTDLVRQGRNALGAELGRGFYAMTRNDMAHGYHTASWHDEPKLRLELHLTHADGTRRVVRSGPGWKATTGPTVFDHLFIGETYDGARAAELDGWTEPGYDDGAWQPVATVAAPKGVPTAESVEPERVIERRRFRSVTEVEPGVFVFDLGQNVTGWTEIRVRGKRGEAVELVHHEKLDDDGTLSPPAGIEPLLINPAQTDVYRLAGTGKVESYRPQFVFHGFQYVRVTGWPEGKPTLDDLTAEIVNTDLRPVGEFSASNSLLDRIVRNTGWAIRQNAHGMPSDTPVYEKTGWTGDGQIMAPSWAWLFDTQRFHSKWAMDIEDSQSGDGQLPEWAPATPTAGSRLGAPHTNELVAFTGPSPGWDVALFEVPWTVHRYFGDDRPLAGYYDAMKRYDAYISSYARDDQYPRGAGGGGFGPGGLGDWATVAGAPQGVWPDSNAWWHRMVEVLARTAELLGHDAETAAYEQKAGRIRTRYNETFLDREAGIYRDPADSSGAYSQHINAMSLELGLVPRELRQTVADNLAADVRARGHHLNTGMVGTRFLWPALSHNGHLQEAILTATQTTYPSYGFWIDKLGWTSLGEYWEETSRSRSHHFLGTIVEWLYEDLAGIEPARPGFEQIEFKPEVPADGLEWVKASHDSPRGEVASEWRKTDGGGFGLKVKVPPNATGLVHVPAGSREAVTAPRDAAFVRHDEDRVVYLVGSGDHRFAVRP